MDFAKELNYHTISKEHDNEKNLLKKLFVDLRKEFSEFLAINESKDDDEKLKRNSVVCDKHGMKDLLNNFENYVNSGISDLQISCDQVEAELQQMKKNYWDNELIHSSEVNPFDAKSPVERVCNIPLQIQSEDEQLRLFEAKEFLREIIDKENKSIQLDELCHFNDFFRAWDFTNSTPPEEVEVEVDCINPLFVDSTRKREMQSALLMDIKRARITSFNEEFDKVKMEKHEEIQHLNMSINRIEEISQELQVDCDLRYFKLNESESTGKDSFSFSNDDHTKEANNPSPKCPLHDDKASKEAKKALEDMMYGKFSEKKKVRNR